MAGRIDAYADTAAFIAALDRSDSSHALFARLFADPPRLLTSALVVAEGHGWFLRRYDRNRALQFLNFLATLPMLEVKAFDSDAIYKVARLVRKFSDQNLTLADAHGLMLMTERRIGLCWSTDRHMTLTGAVRVGYPPA